MRKYQSKKAVGCYDKNWNLITIYPSLTDAAINTGVKVQNIWKVCATDYKSTLGGFNFKFHQIN